METIVLGGIGLNQGAWSSKHPEDRISVLPYILPGNMERSDGTWRAGLTGLERLAGAKRQ